MFEKDPWAINPFERIASVESVLNFCIRKGILSKDNFQEVVDLGCGNGVSAEALRKFSTNLTLVESEEGNIQDGRKGGFIKPNDVVINKTVREYFRDFGLVESLSLVTFFATASYYDDSPLDIFQMAKSHLTPTGVVLLTMEEGNEWDVSELVDFYKAKRFVLPKVHKWDRTGLIIKNT